MNRKFEQCFVEAKFKQATGIALETKRIDMVQASILKSNNPEMMLGYTFTLLLWPQRRSSHRNSELRFSRLSSKCTRPDRLQPAKKASASVYSIQQTVEQSGRFQATNLGFPSWVGVGDQ